MINSNVEDIPITTMNILGSSSNIIRKKEYTLVEKIELGLDSSS